MTQIKIPAFLIKIGKSEHIIDLQKNGTVYFNTVKYFRDVENDEVRGDTFEGASEIKQIENLQIFIKDNLIAKSVPDSTAQLKLFDPNSSGNIYSLYAITEDHLSADFKFDNRLKKFGDKFLIITDGVEFCRRLFEKIKEENYKFNLGYVKYYDKDKYSGKVNVFDKPSVLKYQSEFRIFIKNDSKEPITIKLGSLKDISKLFSITELLKIEIKLAN